MVFVGVVQAVEVCLVAVLVPPATSVRHGTARDERLRVSVPRGERPAVMVRHRVACSGIKADLHKYTILHLYSLFFPG